MGSITNRIKATASRKHVVVITRRKRSQGGFVVIDPDGDESRHATKREALQNLFARVRCAKVSHWALKAVL